MYIDTHIYIYMHIGTDHCNTLQYTATQCMVAAHNPNGVDHCPIKETIFCKRDL